MNFWHWLTTSRYTRRLEDENAEFKARVAKYEAIMWPRIFGVLPAAANRSESSPAVAAKPANTVATPSLGHIRRNSLQNVRAKLEHLTDQDAQTEARMQKAVEAHRDMA